MLRQQVKCIFKSNTTRISIQVSTKDVHSECYMCTAGSLTLQTFITMTTGLAITDVFCFRVTLLNVLPIPAFLVLKANASTCACTVQEADQPSTVVSLCENLIMPKAEFSLALIPLNGNKHRVSFTYVHPHNPVKCNLHV